MSNELAVQDTELDALKEQVRLIEKTEFVPKQYQGKPHAILACILTGRGLGLDPMHALRSIHIVEGKPTLSSELMVALARRAGHSISGETTSEKATVTGTRGDNGDTFTVTFTIEDAKAAGLTGRQNWKNYAEDMLWARAVSRLCRRLFADVLAGVAYTADEAMRTSEEQAYAATEGLPLVDADEPLEGEIFEETPGGTTEVGSGEAAPETTADEGAAPAAETTLFPIPEGARRGEPGS